MSHDLGAVLKELGSRSIQSVLVEGGATVAGEFVDAGLVNKVTFFIAPKIVGGTDAPSAVGGKGVEMMSDALELENVTVTQRGKDIEVTGYPRSNKGPADEDEACFRRTLSLQTPGPALPQRPAHDSTHHRSPRT